MIDLLMIIIPIALVTLHGVLKTLGRIERLEVKVEILSELLD